METTSYAELHVQTARTLSEEGAWPTFRFLVALREREPENLVVRGYLEIVRATIVREILAGPKGLSAVPRLSPDFLSSFDRFDLNVQEGYLISLIDGQSSMQSILKVSPFDPFTTLFNLSRLLWKKAITLPT